MNELIFVRVIELDFAVRGFTVQDADGNYNIYLNARYCREQQRRTLSHEMNHIANGDFDKKSPAHIIERGA